MRADCKSARAPRSDPLKQLVYSPANNSFTRLLTTRLLVYSFTRLLTTRLLVHSPRYVKDTKKLPYGNLPLGNFLYICAAKK